MQDNKPQTSRTPETPEEAADAPQPATAGPVEEATPAEEPEAAGAMAETTPAELEMAGLRSQVADLKDQLLRSLAETENVRRRVQREREDAIKYAAAPVIKDLLGVADNLRRALESVPEELAGDERLKSLVEGIQMTEKELLSAFDRHHIQKIEPLGEKLDPHRHEAMFELPDATSPAGTVVQVVQPGYILHDRLLRPARVGVAKGAPAARVAGGDGDGADEPGSRLDTSA